MIILSILRLKFILGIYLNKMVIEKKKLFFNTIKIILDDSEASRAIQSKKYSYINIFSYDKVDWPGFYVIEKTTALIDLQKEEADIFKNFSDTTRNEIRRTYKNENLKFLFNESPTDDSYKFYKDFEYLQGRVPVSKEALMGIKCFSAYYGGNFISAIYVIDQYPYLRIRSIFSKRLEAEDKELYKIISNASRRLVWEICQWGRKNNFKSLDMASVNFNNPKTANITKFKMSFGGEVVSEYTYEYKSEMFKIFEKWVFIKLWIYRLAHFTRGLFKKF